MKALIFNSGIGKRMGTLTLDKPKCLLKLNNGETLLSRQIRILSYFGIKDFVITTGPYVDDVKEECLKHSNCHFDFVHNDKYLETNYIVSMYNAIYLLEDDFIMLHGDLVFDKRAARKMLNSKLESTCYINKTKPLPEKDFKGRIKNNRLHEVSIKIFDKDCYALQPLYKFSKKTMISLSNVVAKYVSDGMVNVYAENAFNEILSSLNVHPLDYNNCFIEEIDNPDDYEKVSKEIVRFDEKEQEITFNCKSDTLILKRLLRFGVSRPLIVCDAFAVKHAFVEKIKKKYPRSIVFSDFGSNPTIEMLDKGVAALKNNNCDSIVSIGGGSSIDIAKCIKIAINDKNYANIFVSNYPFLYTGIPHLCLPSTAGTGSESTSFAVLYKEGIKYSIDNPSLMPESALFYPSLVSSVPLFQKKCTMLDALCQGIESYWSKGGTKSSKKHSLKAISLVVHNYKKYLENDELAMANMQKAANESGKAINIARTTAAHALSYGLTSLYGIPHGLAVALIIPYVWLLLPENYRKHNLKSINKLLSRNNEFQDGINGFMQIYNSLDLINPCELINTKDIEYLLSHVNIDRLSNFPIVNFDRDLIKNIYLKLSK